MYSGKISLFPREEYCTDHGTATVNQDGERTHMILCPPLSVLVRDATGYVQHRKLQRVGTCPYCPGKHQSPNEIKNCPYLERCRACLKVLTALNRKGNRRCCGLGVQGLPRETPSAQKIKANVIKPGSRADQRR